MDLQTSIDFWKMNSSHITVEYETYHYDTSNELSSSWYSNLDNRSDIQASYYHDSIEGPFV